MVYTTKLNHSRGRPAAILYAVVFHSVLSFTLAVVLIASFLVQPVHQAYASEPEESPPPEPVVIEEPESVLPPSSAVVVSDSEEATEPPEPPPEEVVNETIDEPPQTDEPTVVTGEASTDHATISDTEVDDVAANVAEALPSAANDLNETTAAAASTSAHSMGESEGYATTTPQTSENTLSSSTSVSMPSNSGGPTTDENDAESQTQLASSTATSTDLVTVTATTTPPAVDVDESPDHELPPSSVSDTESGGAADPTVSGVQEELTATTTSTSTPATSTVQYVYQMTGSEHEFTDAQCIAVGDGSFYCSNEQSDDVYLEDDIFSAPDSDGDKEIFVRVRGVETKITDNLVDDLSPQYDPVSNTIAWHRLINDRFQIILYDYATGEETQLTAGTHNNMEPSVSGTYVAWQGWDGHDWEIILSDGIAEPIKLTSNELPDVNPYIHDQYVIWNTIHNNGEKAVVVYDIETGVTELIDDTDGAMIKNPRFILMYDAEYDNGDIVTRGVDLRSGELVPLSATPRDLPSEIPPVDQTGETRALISAKPGVREGEGSKDIQVKSVDTEPPPPEPTDMSTSTLTVELLVSDTPADLSAHTLDLTASSSVAGDHVVIDPLAEHELVIPPPATTSEDIVR